MTATKLPPQTEKAFMADLKAFAVSFSWLWYHTFNSMYSDKGFPDVTMIKDGRIIFAELKRVGGKLTPDQQRWLDALQGAGAEAYVWTPDSWDEIVATLTGKAVIG